MTNRNIRRGFTLSRHHELDCGSCCSIKGFTLIELLIVVLIIGILAAIAVPQYQKAVLKSRFSSLMPLGKALRDGNEAYYLEHGSYATDKDKLDVTNQNPDVEITLGSEEQRTFVQLTRDDINNNLVLYQKQSPNFPGEIHCEAKKDNTLANWLCEDGLKGTLIGEVASGYKVYSLDENFSGTLARTYYDMGDKFPMSSGDVCISTSRKTCAYPRSDGGKCIGNSSYGCSGQPGWYRNYSECEGNKIYACGGAVTFSDYSKCYGNANEACYWNYFSNYSECYGTKEGSCSVRSVSGYSVCHGDATNTCNNGSSAKYSNYSSCIGNATDTCKGGVFSTNSTCQANAVGACVGATYTDSTSYCTGNFCPSGAASSTADKVWYRGEGEEWPDTRESILVDKPADGE